MGFVDGGKLYQEKVVVGTIVRSTVANEAFEEVKVAFSQKVGR